MCRASHRRNFPNNVTDSLKVAIKGKDYGPLHSMRKSIPVDPRGSLSIMSTTGEHFSWVSGFPEKGPGFPVSGDAPTSSSPDRNEFVPLEPRRVKFLIRCADMRQLSFCRQKFEAEARTNAQDKRSVASRIMRFTKQVNIHRRG
jgi:hypothetical protein